MKNSILKFIVVGGKTSITLVIIMVVYGFLNLLSSTKFNIEEFTLAIAVYSLYLGYEKELKE